MKLFIAAIDVLAIVITVVMLFMKKFSLSVKREEKLFYFLTLTLFGVLFTDIFAWLLDGVEFAGATVVSYALDTIYYLLQIIYSWLWLVFSDIWNTNDYEKSIGRARWYSIPMIIEIVMIFANLFTGWIFTISEQNVYSRGSMYEINLIPYVLYIVTALLFSLISASSAKDQQQKKLSLFLTACMAFPICGFIITAFYYGGSWLWPFIAISQLMIYIYRQQVLLAEERHKRDSTQLELAEKERKSAEARMAIMRSQMQPHFMYNTLSMIKLLCLRDPQKAREVIDQFNIFLRANMDSSAMQKPVMFSKELEHTKAYTAIETLRNESINVTYDIQATSFRLPSLSLQPIVENAIKHALYRRKSGTVKVSTWSDDQNNYVLVEDDGSVYDTKAVPSIAEQHMGVTYARDRLQYLLNGTLEITSSAESGTSVKMTIPRDSAEG